MAHSSCRLHCCCRERSARLLALSTCRFDGASQWPHSAAEAKPEQYRGESNYEALFQFLEQRVGRPTAGQTPEDSGAGTRDGAEALETGTTQEGDATGAAAEPTTT